MDTYIRLRDASASCQPPSSRAGRACFRPRGARCATHPPGSPSSRAARRSCCSSPPSPPARRTRAPPSARRSSPSIRAPSARVSTTCRATRRTAASATTTSTAAGRGTPTASRVGGDRASRTPRRRHPEHREPRLRRRRLHATTSRSCDRTNYSNTPTFPGLDVRERGHSRQRPGARRDPPYLTPQAGGDAHAAGGHGHRRRTAARPGPAARCTPITWTATDNVGVVSVDVYYRDGAAAAWTPLALEPGATAARSSLVRAQHADDRRRGARGRRATPPATPAHDASNAELHDRGARRAASCRRTLRDFDHARHAAVRARGNFQDHTCLRTCHGGYDAAVEPGRNLEGQHDGAGDARPALLRLPGRRRAGRALRRRPLPALPHAGRLDGGPQPTPTGGSQLDAADRDGVHCDFCHRAGRSGLQAGRQPGRGRGGAGGPDARPRADSYVERAVRGRSRRRPARAVRRPGGAARSSSTRRSTARSDLCGTCHDVLEPGLRPRRPAPTTRRGRSTQQRRLGHVATCSSRSSAPTASGRTAPSRAGVYAPEFAGNKPDGIVATCQDCHMRDVTGHGLQRPGRAAARRPAAARHDGRQRLDAARSSATLYPGEVDADRARGGAAARRRRCCRRPRWWTSPWSHRGRQLAGRRHGDQPDRAQAADRLPGGPADVAARRGARRRAATVVYESGRLRPGHRQLTTTPDAVIYETEPGVSPALGAAHRPAGRAHRSTSC